MQSGLGFPRPIDFLLAIAKDHSAGDYRHPTRVERVLPALAGEACRGFVRAGLFATARRSGSGRIAGRQCFVQQFDPVPDRHR